MELKKIEIGKIKANPYQPRMSFDKAELQDLADNIKAHGMIEPIVVTQRNNNFMIVAGERRFRASQMAGINKLFAIVKHYDSDASIKRDSLIENELREDLTTEEFKTFAYSLAKSLKFPVDRDLPMRLANYILGSAPGRPSTTTGFYTRLRDVITVDNAPKKVKKFVDSGTIDVKTAASIANIGDKDARDKVLKIVKEKAKTEPGLKTQVTTEAIRTEVKRINQERKHKEEMERLKKIKEAEAFKVKEREMINTIVVKLGRFKDELRHGSNQVYSLNKKSFLNKLSEDSRRDILDSVKPVNRELDRAKHIVGKLMEVLAKW